MSSFGQRFSWDSHRDEPESSAPAATYDRVVQRAALAGRLTSGTNPGGREVQLEATVAALRRLGMDARPWRPWEDEWSRLDVLHLIGSAEEHLEVAAAAQRCGVKLVVSPSAWLDPAQHWSEGASWLGKAWRRGKSLLRSVLPRTPAWRRKLYDAADLLLPNSQVEASQLMRVFQTPASKIRVVPSGAERRFAHPEPLPDPALEALGRFVLYAGRIEPRKNQLGFLQAMRGVSIPVVVLGDPVAGQESYYKACRRIAGPLVRFIPRIPHRHPRMESIYARCGCAALCSWFETPGLTLLEAAMSGAPIVAPTGGAAREYFGPHARYVHPTDSAGIQAAVVEAFHAPRDPVLADLVRDRFTWDAVAGWTADAYETLFHYGA